MMTVDIANGVLRFCKGNEKTVVIPEGVHTIGPYAFDWCRYVERIFIPPSVTKIECDFLTDCKNLKEVHITDITAWCNIEFDGSFANPLYVARELYVNGKRLEHLVIPEDVTVIRRSAFVRCNSLVSVTIPSSLTRIEMTAFFECDNIREVHIADFADWLAIQFDESSSNPLQGEAVLLVNGSPLRDVVFPEGIRNIGNYVFADYRLLSSVVIPESVTGIGDGAFKCCESLADVHIPESVTAIGKGAFKGCKLLRSIRLPRAVTRIESATFSRCTSLVDIVIPESVTSFGRYAFSNCSALKSICIPDTVTEIEDCVFCGCDSLETVSIPDGNTQIASLLFEDCRALRTVTIPDSVTAINENAFAGCRSLTEIRLPASITAVRKNAFHNCTGLKAVHTPDIASWCAISFYNIGVTNPLHYAHNLYVNGEAVTHLVIPDSVTTLGLRCFEGYHALERITIPPSVTVVKNDAFRDCPSLKEIHITDPEAWCSILFDAKNANPLGLGATLFLNGVAVNNEDLHPLLVKNIQKSIDMWEMRVIVHIDAFYHNYSEKEHFRFTENDAVIENGMLVGFNFHGTFVRLSDAGKELPPSYIPPRFENPRNLGNNVYNYDIVMVLTRRY